MATEPAPFIFQPAFRWSGNDGNWSTFQVNIGTPEQSFDVLPSTCNGEIWVPLPDACPSSFPACAAARGVLSSSGSTSQGFQVDESDTWSQTGIYDLLLEEALFESNDTGLYGADTVSMGDGAKSTLENQTIAGVATPNFWLGSLGLSIQPSGFSVQSEHDLPLLSAMREMNLTPSASYGFHAGASYSKSTVDETRPVLFC